MDSTWRLVSGWQRGGVIERLPLPRPIRGRLRASLETLPFLSLPRPDVIWTSLSTDLAPFAWPAVGPFCRPVVLDLDWTLDQREQLAPYYYGRPPRSGAIAAFNRAREQAVWDRVTLFTPWSQWAADALRRRGVSDDRIQVLPPGVDIERWQPAAMQRPPSTGRPLRLLFVGGDFRRKGGELLLEVMRSAAGEQLALDIVTRDPVTPTRGVTVHRLEPNDPALASLYQDADLFVMPSLAECFGIATIEAMASGLPVLVSDRGASREIVEHNHTGWLIEPTVRQLHDRLESLANDQTMLQSLGRNARVTAVSRFNGRENDMLIADVLIALAHAHVCSSECRVNHRNCTKIDTVINRRSTTGTENHPNSSAQ